MIIDTHVHFIDPTRFQGVQYPDPIEASRLYRTVLPLHYKAITASHGITGVIVVEASHWIEDNQWILDLAKKEPLIVGFSGNLDMRANNFESNLSRFASNSLFRGIRPRMLNPADYSDPKVVNSAALLESYDLEMDAHIVYQDIEHLISLVNQVPKLRIVINHIGAGRPINGKTANQEWANAMGEISKYPNIYCKVSAVLQHSEILPAPYDVDFYRPTLDVLWDLFGENRLVYGSNWPNVEQVGPYSQELGLAKEYFGEKGRVASEKFFWENAKVAYKWIDRSGEVR